MTMTPSRGRAVRYPASARRPQWQAGAVLMAASLLGAVGGLCVLPVVNAAPAQTGAACAAAGGWIDVKSGRAIERADLFRDLALPRTVVLLGETHTEVDDHRWQLQTLAALHGRGANLVIGFEAFPRRLQPVLDEWIDGKLTDEAFLKASEYRQVWGYDAALYMPLFEFARINHIPMIALNVERGLVSRVGQEGWEHIPAAEREGLSDPAPATPAYQRELAKVYLLKKSLPPGTDPLSVPEGASPPAPDEAALAAAIAQPEFQRFVQAQQTWDRAMAEGLAEARRKFANATVVGILGSGHVEGGNGVPHQLDNLGVLIQMSLLPVEVGEACPLVGTSYADAVFTLPHQEEAPPPQRPRLGVFLAQGEGAPRIRDVVKGSVAEATGLRAGDQVVRAAGVETRLPDDLVEIVSRQAPGTWLPLGIRRDGADIDLIAKFPAPAK